ncbi:TOG array regulator of axonemal microtubules protein 1 isoform X1 [Drosophila virilis]|uniref:TOG array regulator of axonemal microtubules protein 1 isoform X1 n=1 Tax=Drosophila virilis TaxID=7244 RepID=UPI0013964EA9|nr:uncharacterized protein LOC6635658 isoform X1 [Drosophila virilis]
MFFQRFFERNNSSANATRPTNGNSDTNENVIHHISGTNNVIGEDKDNNNNQSSTSADSHITICPTKMQRRHEQTVTAVQLTPLWEHVLRTRRLPETICPATMFAEFHERLQDPEWQVRQHALRVLLDVLVIMGSKADKHSMHFLIDLIKNLGHQAPTVRKGALDCLRVYLSETGGTEMVMLQILDTGLAQQPTFDERLSCGVLLSLPPLLQSILHTPQSHFIVKHTIKRLVQRLQLQQTQQEITLKVLAKISELLGAEEIESYLEEVDGVDALSLYNQLCKVYGISNKPLRTDGSMTSAGAWRALPREHIWRSSSISHEPKVSLHSEKGKVIMETEIQINDDTLTMRILEAETETEDTDSPIIDTSELVCRPFGAPQSPREMDAGILQIISDSEMEEMTQNETNLNTPFRNLKRVTFGGEVVKMRTPDSDATSSTNNIESTMPIYSRLSLGSLPPNETASSASLLEGQHADNNLTPAGSNKMTVLTLEIPIDNTKPLPRARSAQSPQPSKEQARPTHNKTSSYTSPKRDVSYSPVYRSSSISPAGSNTASPKVPHKEIEVLHNLQRDPDPSPRSLQGSDSITPVISTAAGSGLQTKPAATPNSWEDLDIVNHKTIVDLRSGDWRNRLQGIAQLEVALSSSSNLVLVQPYLDSLLRTLLSSERNFEVAELKREVLVNLISRLPLDNLEERTPQILSGLCRQGNAGANRVCKALMQRLPAGTIVAKLTAPEYLHAKSSKFRDHALQMSIYSLMSFPGTCFDINILAAQMTYAALNRKRRVRQAALEVFAVLADISSVDQILQIVAEITDDIESGSALLKAVKMRLSRLQLPLITPDGSVLYTFYKTEQTGISRFGADMDWIALGEGSASPNAVKRRRQHLANKKRMQDNADEEVTGINNHSCNADENLHRHSFHSPPEALDMSRASNDFFQKKIYGTSGKHVNCLERRVVTKACSESSVDGRSTDSTTTSCSSGSGSGSSSFIQLTTCNGGINRRLTRQNSRFPAMRRQTDFISNFMRNIQRTPYPYSFEDTKISKVNDDLQKNHRHIQQVPKKPNSSQHTFAQQNWTDNCSQSQANSKQKETKKPDINSQSDTAVNKDAEILGNFNVKVEPAHEHTTSTAVQVTAVTSGPHQSEGSPLSVRSTSYSQKSTASAKSTEVDKPNVQHSNGRDELEQQFGELVVDDIEEETEPPFQEATLKRNESVNSLQSKTESIKTQLEDATPQMSRAQSIKSLAIEEEIDSNNSFVVVEELQNELQTTAVKSPPIKQLSELSTDNETFLASLSRASSSKKDEITHDDRAIHSRSISLDSLYGRRPASKQGSLDISSTATDNSSQTGSHPDNSRLAPKSQHTSLKQKSKTSYLLRGQRRVSPVKQAIKISPTELFPPHMSRFEKPREALIKTLDQLDSNNWEVNITGLKYMVRLIRHHADFLDSHMHMTCIQLTRSVRNLRSQVARAACQAATELFTLKCKSLEIECDDLVCALLHRTADTNRFLRADATRALESLVDNVQPPKVLNILTSKGAQHQNAIVRTTTAKLLFRLVERLGCDRIYSMGRESRDKFFMVGANLLLEGSLETRSYAKSLFRALSEHGSYQRLLLEVIPPRTYRNVEKTLRSITR